MNEGGDKHTPRARADIAKREQQIVALKLRGIPTPDIARVVGVSARAVQVAFKKAIHRETSRTIQTHHRIELAKLDMEEANMWRNMDANKGDWQVQVACTSQLRGIHIRRAHLLGLDAPRLDVTQIYSVGGEEASEERRTKELTWLAMPPEERARIYDSLYEARKRLNAPIETTATVTLGPDNRNDEAESSDDE